MKKFKIAILLLCLIVPFSFVGCENKNKKTLSTPTILEISGGTIVFEQVDNAEYYTLLINDNSLTIDVSHNNNVEIVDDLINYDATKIFVVGNSYSVKIKANASSMKESKFSPTYSYKHNGNIEKPTNLKIHGSTLTWNTVENASYYIVKIITPADTVLFDKQGNVLENEDPASITKADLTEYSFNTNQFDFSSLLQNAGIYKFYVSAVLSIGSNYVESGYSNSVSHTHYVELSAPINGAIAKQGTDLTMLTTVDINSNAISIICNGFEKTVEINGSEQSITIVNDNLLNINLTKFFQPQISSGKLNFDDLTQFAFQTQSKFIAPNITTCYYTNSAYSDFAYYENTYKLSTPTLTIEQDLTNSCFVASWTTSDKHLVSGYKLLVSTSTELKEYTVDSNISSKLIYDDFVAIAVKAIGVGNYNSSALSSFVSNPTLSASLPNVSTNINGSTITWNNLSGAYYIVEFKDNYIVTSNNSFTFDLSEPTDNSYYVGITAIKAGFKHSSKHLSVPYSEKLATPTFSYDQGFTSSNLYELTFTGVDNAYGYYVYLKTKDGSDFEKIDYLYTSTRIDLSNYICREGNYTDYEVKVQAVADSNSIYLDSEKSVAITVSHVHILNKPSFYKIGDTIVPISKQVLGNSTKHILKFYGVESAGSYEVLINYNKLTVPVKSSFYTGIYEIDISNYMIAANNYELKVRALPREDATNIQPSSYIVANYILTKQLETVQNVAITENDGIYTLSFTPVDNAERYKVRIVKENDSNYVSYLNELGLSNVFVITQSIDVTEFVKQHGVYYFYITALAPQENSYYADANESSSYGYLSKLTTLLNPTNITHANLTKDCFELNWNGDPNADYYLVKLTDPNNISFEFKVYNTTDPLNLITTDINKYMTIQGDYLISIYSMITPLSESSKQYTSSSATNVVLRYLYQTRKDFERYLIYSYGNIFDFTVDNVNDLKHLLWYHYLYEINPDSNLAIMLNPQVKEDLSVETTRETILRLASEANDSLLHNFNNDEQWLNLINISATDDKLFEYLCQKLLEIYPEFNILENFSLHHIVNTANNSDYYQLNYKNSLNTNKTNNSTPTFINTNYGNDFKYIDIYSRRSPTGVFKIDSREEMLVTTTEQLLQAVQHNRKPKFVGDSSTAEAVYNNAKIILSAIATNSMSDLEKTTAIFNWMEYAFDLTYYNIDKKAHLSGSVEAENIETYGLNKLYYLEGLLEYITLAANGDIVIGSNLATSKSYSKVFALLCGIEGIEATVINGQYSYYDITTESDRIVDHTWNKVNIDTSIEGSGKKWYSVDLTFSDNRIYFNDLTKGYGISSHSYFLTTDSLAQFNLGLEEKTHLIEKSYQLKRLCSTAYDFYSNSSFGLTYDNILATIRDFSNSDTPVEGFEYALAYSSSQKYQQYSKTTGYGNLQSFLLNSMIYAKYKADQNTSRKSVFEFKISWNDNGGSNIFNITKLREIFDTAPTQYNLRLNLITDASGSVYYVADNERQTTTVMYIVQKTA